MRLVSLFLPAISLCLGCTSSLHREPLAPNVQCANLDNSHRTWGAVAKFTGVLAGAGGLATLPIDSDQKTLRLSIGIGGLLMGGLAAASVYIEQDAASSYANQCTVDKLNIGKVKSGL